MSDTASAAHVVATKGEFAQLAGVTPGRVSQWISEGKITGAALVGEGRHARIDVERAKAQLRLKIDVGQRFGNGIGTRLDPSATDSDVQPSSGPANASRDPLRPGSDPIEEQIKREKLADLQSRNRQRAEDELVRRGVYSRTDDVRSGMNKLAAGMLNVFEGALADFATAIASHTPMSHRDALHLLRQEFRAVRARAAGEASKTATGLAAIRADEVSDASDPALGSA